MRSGPGGRSLHRICTAFAPQPLKPYRCKEGFYLRRGATTQKLSTAEIRQLVLQAGDFHFDESVNQHFRYPQDFDQNRYRAYLQAAGIRVQARPEGLLASLDAAVPAAAGISLRQGGVLFFAREPQRFVLFRARYVERVGSGIPRIRQALEENGNPPMEISASNFFVVTFRPRLETESPLSARQSRLFHFVAERTRTTKEEAATFLAVSGDTALRELRVLRDAGLVERGGVGKAAFYQRARHRPG